ncbi:MFS domain-containing protein [Psidium guajava]|nr:MFS domain-containing protein [Psidium guajava]
MSAAPLAPAFVAARGTSSSFTALFTTTTTPSGAGANNLWLAFSIGFWTSGRDETSREHGMMAPEDVVEGHQTRIRGGESGDSFTRTISSPHFDDVVALVGGDWRLLPAMVLSMGVADRLLIFYRLFTAHGSFIFLYACMFLPRTTSVPHHPRTSVTIFPQLIHRKRRVVLSLVGQGQFIPSQLSSASTIAFTRFDNITRERRSLSLTLIRYLRS